MTKLLILLLFALSFAKDRVAIAVVDSIKDQFDLQTTDHVHHEGFKIRFKNLNTSEIFSVDGNYYVNSTVGVHYAIQFWNYKTDADVTMYIQDTDVTNCHFRALANTWVEFEHCGDYHMWKILGIPDHLGGKLDQPFYSSLGRLRFVVNRPNPYPKPRHNYIRWPISSSKIVSLELPANSIEESSVVATLAAQTIRGTMTLQSPEPVQPHPPRPEYQPIGISHGRDSHEHYMQVRHLDYDDYYTLDFQVKLVRMQ